MAKIKRDFIFKELRRLVLCAMGIAACLVIILRYCPKLASYYPWLVLIAVIALAALRSAVLFHAGTRNLTDNDIHILDREYTASHPVYKVWQGEIHLLQTFIVCRNRGRLLFIPVHKIERIERRFDRVGMRKVPFARFIMDTSQTVNVGFSPNHPKDSEAVFKWLNERLKNASAG